MTKFQRAAGIALLIPALALAHPLPGANGLSVEIQSRGAKAVYGEYTAAGGKARWQALLKRVESGDTQWLAIADELRPVADASYAEDLEFSVATALPANAAGVLRLKNFSLDKVCDVPCLEPSAATVRKFRARASRALEGVREPALQDRRTQCLAILMSP